MYIIIYNIIKKEKLRKYYKIFSKFFFFKYYFFFFLKANAPLINDVIPNNKAAAPAAFPVWGSLPGLFSGLFSGFCSGLTSGFSPGVPSGFSSGLVSSLYSTYDLMAFSNCLFNLNKSSLFAPSINAFSTLEDAVFNVFITSSDLPSVFVNNSFACAKLDFANSLIASNVKFSVTISYISGIPEPSWNSKFIETISSGFYIVNTL